MGISNLKGNTTSVFGHLKDQIAYSFIDMTILTFNASFICFVDYELFIYSLLWRYTFISLTKISFQRYYRKNKCFAFSSCIQYLFIVLFKKKSYIMSAYMNFSVVVKIANIFETNYIKPNLTLLSFKN